MASSAAIERTIARNLYNVSLSICIDPSQTPHGTGAPNVKQGRLRFLEAPRDGLVRNLFRVGCHLMRAAHHCL